MKDITKTILIFGSLCAAILLLLQIEKWSLFSFGGSESLYPIFSGILLLILGILGSRYFIFKREKRKKLHKKSSLSERELNVLHLVAEGKSNQEIADELYIAETTVKSHVSNIMKKLDAKRRTDAVRIGKELQII